MNRLHGQVRIDEFSILCLRWMLFLTIMIGFLLNCSFGLSEAAETLSVSKVTRISHPAYRAQNMWYGVRNPWNRDYTRIMLFEARVSHPDYPGVQGKGLVWGMVGDLKSWTTLAAYEAARHPLPPVNDNSGWRPDSAYWSPFVGEENIIYGIYTPTKTVRKLNVDTGVMTDIVSYDPGDGTVVTSARSFGFTADNKFTVNFSNESTTSGGYEIDVSTGAKTRYIDLPGLCDADYPRFPNYSHGHIGKSPDGSKTAWKYGEGSYTSVYYSETCTQVRDTIAGSKCMAHASWTASESWYIGDDNGDVSACGTGSAPAIVPFSIFQIQFDGSSFVYEKLFTQNTARGWNDGTRAISNYHAHFLATLRKDGKQALITSTDGLYSYEDNVYMGKAPWGYEGFFLVDFALATGADGIAPSVPSGLSATPVSSSQINLAWRASTDNVGVAGYRIYRNGSQIGTVTGTSYSNTGLSASTAYSYTVSAYDAAGNVSGQSASVTATTQSAVDTQAPSVPANVTATAVFSTQINISWNPSTDNIGVAGYKLYKNGNLVATISKTNYSDTGLSASTTYTYSVSAYDVAGNVSGQSIQATATTKALTSYTILKTATSAIIDGDLSEYRDSNAITFSPSSGGNIVMVKALWDDQGLYLAYEITDTHLNAEALLRDGEVWNDDSVEWFIDVLSNGGASDNLYAPYMLSDDYHGVVNIINAQYDSQGSSSGSPSSLWNGNWQSAIRLNGTNNNNADSDTGYTFEIKIPWTIIGYSSVPVSNTSIGISFAHNDKDALSTASLMWPNITSAFENASQWQRALLSSTTVNQLQTDIQAPSVPSGVTATAVSSTQINLNWAASTDNVKVTGYKVYRNGSQIATVTTTSYSNSGLAASTSYSYTVSAYDAAGNGSSQSAAASVTTPAAPDTQSPTIPSNVTATAVSSAKVNRSWSLIGVQGGQTTSVASSAQINLSWSASTDNVKVAGYKVFRNGVQVATTAGTLYADDNLAPSTTYTYTASAYDAAGNVSGQSAAASATTPAAPDTQAPSVPSGVTAKAISSTQINLSWAASTDNVGVTGYKIFRNGSQISTVTTTSYTNTSLTAATAYTYTVSAYDAAGNISGQSVSASATTTANNNARRIFIWRWNK